MTFILYLLHVETLKKAEDIGGISSVYVCSLEISCNTGESQDPTCRLASLSKLHGKTPASTTNTQQSLSTPEKLGPDQTVPSSLSHEESE